MDESDDEGVIWLVHWEYGDKSGGDFVRAFGVKEDAEELLDILQKHGGEKTYLMHRVRFIESY